MIPEPGYAGHATRRPGPTDGDVAPFHGGFMVSSPAPRPLGRMRPRPAGTCPLAARTGQRAWRMTSSVTLPIRTRPSPVRPCVPITIRSAPDLLGRAEGPAPRVTPPRSGTPGGHRGPGLAAGSVDPPPTPDRPRGRDTPRPSVRGRRRAAGSRGGRGGRSAALRIRMPGIRPPGTLAPEGPEKSVGWRMVRIGGPAGFLLSTVVGARDTPPVAPGIGRGRPHGFFDSGLGTRS